MTQFEQKPFFGGAITGVVPQGWIDGSMIREVPDHQELFLSPTTLSSLIFEINEYASRQQVLSTVPETALELAKNATSAAAVGGMTMTHDNTDTEGATAAMYYLYGLCERGDTVGVISVPRKIQLQKFTSLSSTGISAFKGTVRFTTPRKRRRGEGGGEEGKGEEGMAQQRPDVAFLSVDSSLGMSDSGSSAAGADKSTATCHFLLVRLPANETDLLVFVNVPHDEYDLQEDPRALAREEELASDLIEKYIEVLDVNDWGLFG